MIEVENAIHGPFPVGYTGLATSGYHTVIVIDGATVSRNEVPPDTIWWWYPEHCGRHIFNASVVLPKAYKVFKDHPIIGKELLYHMLSFES